MSLKINRPFGVCFNFEPEEAVEDPTTDFTEEQLENLERRAERLAEEVVGEYLDDSEEVGEEDYTCPACGAEDSFKPKTQFLSEYYNDTLQKNYEYGWDM